MSVDTENNVITLISAEHASRKDSQLLIKNTKATMARLEDCGLQVDTVLADAGFSSGENYATLEALKIYAYNIPLHGTYETHRDGFKYDGRRNADECESDSTISTDSKILLTVFRCFTESMALV